MDFKNYLKSLQIVHLAMMAGIIAFAMVAFYLNLGEGFGKAFLDEVPLFLLIVLVFTSGSIVASFIIERSRKENILTEKDLSKKLALYRSLLVITLALHEGSAFLSIVMYLLTGNLFFLGFTFALLFLMLTRFPTESRIVRQLSLDRQQQQQLSEIEINS